MPKSASEFASVLAPIYGVIPAGTIEPLKGDASSRCYFRFRVDSRAAAAGGPASVVIMQWPELDALGNSLDVQAEAFVDVRALLAGRGIDVPAIYARAPAERLMALEDLGDETFEARLKQTARRDWPEPYGHAIDRLADLHARCAPPQPPDSSVVYRRRLEARLLRWELDHFREWGIEAVQGALEPAARAKLDGLFDALVRAIVALPDGFVHRDYQSRNLLWVGSRLVVIDFQDAFVGPAAYDLVALLCDSYADIDADLQAQMIARYAERRGYAPEAHAALRRGFDLIAVQRKLKDAGRFVFIDRVRKDPSFLRYYPGSLAYADRALLALGPLPEALALGELLRALLPGFPNCPVPQAVAGSA